MIQRNLGATYQIRLEGERQENLKLARELARQGKKAAALERFATAEKLAGGDPAPARMKAKWLAEWGKER